MRIFSYDGPLVSGLTKIMDGILLSILWLLFSLPIVTIGASSAAMYTTVYQYLRKDKGHLWQTFWGAFRENLRRSIPAWLIAMAIQALLVVDTLVFRTMELQGMPLGKLYWLMLVLCAISITWVVYLTAYSARFNGSVKDVLKFSFLLMVMHPLRALSVLVTVLAALALVILRLGFVVFLPTVACLICSFIIEGVFLLHMSEEDIRKTGEEEDTL